MDSLRAFFDRAGKEHDGMLGDWPVLHAPVVTGVAS
jgi:hypothetical protein